MKTHNPNTMGGIALDKQKIVILGFGTIGPPSLELILNYTKINPTQVTVIADQYNNGPIHSFGVKFENFKITPENYASILSLRLNEGDFLINLTVGISSLDLITLCHQIGVLYLDTSNENWSTNNTEIKTTTFERRQKFLEAKNKFLNGPTALVCHGANPGLVTHFAKRAILDIAATLLPPVEKPNNVEDWGKLAYRCGISSIHISERDNQRSAIGKKNNEYVNTWSIDGFLDEAFEPVGFAWGSHENAKIDGLIKFKYETNNCFAVELNRKAFETKIYSWVPNSGSFSGYLIPHPEAYSIAELFRYQINKLKTYQPTVHFVYLPCSDAESTMIEVAKNGWNLTKPKRILQNDIIDGMDALGILMIRENSEQIYWFGSQLSIHDTRYHLKNTNATSLQVAAGVLSGFIWLTENQDRGLVEPEQVDFARVLEVASPYLGELAGYWSDWPHSNGHKITSHFLQNRYLLKSTIPAW